MKNNNIKYAIIQESENNISYINGARCQVTIVTERPVAYEDTKEEAKKAYEEAKEKLHKKFLEEHK